MIVLSLKAFGFLLCFSLENLVEAPMRLFVSEFLMDVGTLPPAFVRRPLFSRSGIESKELRGGAFKSERVTNFVQMYLFGFTHLKEAGVLMLLFYLLLLFVQS